MKADWMIPIGCFNRFVQGRIAVAYNSVPCGLIVWVYIFLVKLSKDFSTLNEKFEHNLSLLNILTKECFEIH